MTTRPLRGATRSAPRAAAAAANGAPSKFGPLSATNKAPGFKDAWDSLTGVGIGLTVYPTQQTTFKLEVATPAGGQFHAADGEKGRVWASISASF